ncbi:helix-turn-helix domain-containing protein [Paenibacillus sp. WQ 127069]|uniref:Helix-turn-helix domain-containing protein n=1 Tax=Paenibacillus baimaensis TaxID=2982185 RepID=A0ABT2UKE0_9BACL|nr:helix-turn-helix domain-containing protein [Paenibacillus sp. WQ 127069]MCU6795082.1 helix-turn-helix domain-containing protein [Paenibacillus sp. WQ 127069]
MITIIRRALHSLQFRSLFIKLLLSLTILLLLIIFLVTSFLQYRFQISIAENEIDKSSFQRLEETKLFMDALLRNINSMTLQLANTTELSNKLEAEDLTILSPAIKKFGNNFRESFISSYSVNSAFIYIKGEGIVQVPITGGQAVRKFDFAQITQEINHMGKDEKWIVQTLPDNHTLIILIRPIPLLGTDINGAIIVSFDPAELFKSPFVQRDQERIWIILPDGQHAFETKNGTIVPSDVFGPARAKALSNITSFQGRLEDFVYGFRVNPSSLSHWKYVYAMPFHTESSKVYNLVVISVLLTTLGLMYYVFRKVRQIQSYIATLTIMVGRNKSNRQEKQQDEFLYLISEFNTIMEQDTILQQRLEQSEMMLRQNFLQQMLIEPTVFTEDRLMKLQELGIEVSGHGIFVMVVRIDDYLGFKDKYKPSDQSLLGYFIGKLAEEQLHGKFNVLFTLFKGRDVVILCNLTSETPISLARSNVLHVVNTICQYIHSYLELTISAGIGDIHSDLGYISESYNQALQALEFRIFKGHKALIPIWHVQSNQPYIMLMYNERKEIETSLSAAIKEADLNKVKWCLDQLKKMIKKLDGCPMTLIRHTFQELVMVMVHYSADSNIPTPEVPQDLHDSLMKLETLDEIIEWMEQTANRIISSASHSPTIRNRTPVEQILEYIQTNHDKEISLNGIAEQLGLDPSYLSRLFKQAVGLNFMEYLLSMRVKHAKMLLVTTDHSVTEISQMVGYHNTASFIRIFKKHEGVPPGQYRTENTNKKLDIQEIY